MSVLATEDLNNAVDSAKRFVTNFTAEFMASAGFVYCDGRWDQVPMCFDTLSMTCMWNLDAVPKPLPLGWVWISRYHIDWAMYGCKHAPRLSGF